MELNQKIIAENLKSLRENRGLSQTDLATKLNISQQAVAKWERPGGSIPDLELLVMLSQMYGMPLDQLLSLGKPQNIDTSKNGYYIYEKIVTPSFEIHLFNDQQYSNNILSIEIVNNKDDILLLDKDRFVFVGENGAVYSYFEKNPTLASRNCESVIPAFIPSKTKAIIRLSYNGVPEGKLFFNFSKELLNKYIYTNETINAVFNRINLKFPYKWDMDFEQFLIEHQGIQELIDIHIALGKNIGENVLREALKINKKPFGILPLEKTLCLMDISLAEKLFDEGCFINPDLTVSLSRESKDKSALLLTNIDYLPDNYSIKEWMSMELIHKLLDRRNDATTIMDSVDLRYIDENYLSSKSPQWIADFKEPNIIINYMCESTTIKYLTIERLLIPEVLGKTHYFNLVKKSDKMIKKFTTELTLKEKQKRIIEEILYLISFKAPERVIDRYQSTIQRLNLKGNKETICSYARKEELVLPEWTLQYIDDSLYESNRKLFALYPGSSETLFKTKVSHKNLLDLLLKRNENSLLAALLVLMRESKELTEEDLIVELNAAGRCFEPEDFINTFLVKTSLFNDIEDSVQHDFYKGMIDGNYLKAKDIVVILNKIQRKEKTGEYLLAQLVSRLVDEDIDKDAGVACYKTNAKYLDEKSEKFFLTFLRTKIIQAYASTPMIAIEKFKELAPYAVSKTIYQNKLLTLIDQCTISDAKIRSDHARDDDDDDY